MKTFPHKLNFRIMSEGDEFVVEQNCGPAGWWEVLRSRDLSLCTISVQMALAKEKLYLEAIASRRQIWPIEKLESEGT